MNHKSSRDDERGCLELFELFIETRKKKFKYDFAHYQKLF